jgi:hypothetical protein
VYSSFLNVSSTPGLVEGCESESEFCEKEISLSKLLPNCGSECPFWFCNEEILLSTLVSIFPPLQKNMNEILFLFMKLKAYCLEIFTRQLELGGVRDVAFFIITHVQIQSNIVCNVHVNLLL